MGKYGNAEVSCFHYNVFIIKFEGFEVSETLEKKNTLIYNINATILTAYRML